MIFIGRRHLSNAKRHTRDSRQWVQQKPRSQSASTRFYTFVCSIRFAHKMNQPDEDDEIVEEVISTIHFQAKKLNIIFAIHFFSDSRVFIETASQQFVRVSVSKQEIRTIAGRCGSGKELCETHSSGSEGRLCIGHGITALRCIQR